MTQNIFNAETNFQWSIIQVNLKKKQAMDLSEVGKMGELVKK